MQMRCRRRAGVSGAWSLFCNVRSSWVITTPENSKQYRTLVRTAFSMTAVSSQSFITAFSAQRTRRPAGDRGLRGGSGRGGERRPPRDAVSRRGRAIPVSAAPGPVYRGGTRGTRAARVGTAGMWPRRRARAATVLLVAVLCGRSDAQYNATKACEMPLQALTTTDVRQNTTTTVSTIGDAVVYQTVTTTQTLHNATLVLWSYFSHDLVDVDPTAPGTLHTDATASAMCSMAAPLTMLKAVLEQIVTDCQYTPLHSGAHIFQALYRIETECSVNATGHHCVTPKNFFDKPYYNSANTVDTQSPEPGTTVVTTVTTETAHPMTWGTADLMLQACPGSCPLSGEKNRTGYCSDEDQNPAPSVADCCMKIMWDYGTKYLGLGPSDECSQFRNLGESCLIDPPVAAEISSASGGAVKTRSGAGVDIPAGAIPSDQCSDPCVVSVAPVNPAVTAAAIKSLKKQEPLWSKLKTETVFLDLGPDGLKFSENVTVCLKAASNLTEENWNSVKIYQFNLTSGSIIGDQFEPKSYDANKGLLCFMTTHFSSYGGIDYVEMDVDTSSASSSDDRTAVILGEFSARGPGDTISCS